MYLRVFAVVAPCFGPCDQVMVFRCIPHQIPSYFIGWIQRVSAICDGGLRLRPSTDGTRSATRSATCTVRHGVRSGVRPRTLMPSAHGASAALSVRPSIDGP